MHPYRYGKGPVQESSVINATYVSSPRRAQLPTGPLNPGPRRNDYDLSGLQNRLNYDQEENRRLSEELQALKKKFEHLNTYKELQLQLNESVRGNQIESFKKQNYAQIDTMNSEINMLKGVLSMREDQVDDLKIRNSNIQNDNRVLMDSQYRLKDLEAKTASVLNELNVRSSECERFTDRVNELDLRLKESNEENIKLRDILHGRTNDNANLEARLTDFEAQVNNLRRLQLLDKENEGNMLATIHQLELKISHNESFIDNLKKMNHVEFEKYRAHTERIKNALNDKEKECIDLRDEGNQLLNHLEFYKRKQDELLAELNDLRNNFDNLRADREQQIQALEDQIAHLRSQVAVRERELLNLNDRLAKAEARINELLVENAELMKVLENLKIKFAELERSHANQVEMREAKFRADAQLMQQNLQDAIDRYQTQIMDIKRVLERKDNQIIGIKQEFLNQSQQNQALQRREEALLNQLRQGQFRVQQADREKDMQIAFKEQKHRNQLQTIKKIHAAQFDSLKQESNQLHALIKGKSDENESLAQQNSNFLDNYHKIKASEVRLISESENLRNKLSRLEYVKNKEIYNQEEMRRSQLGQQSRQHSDEIEHLRQQIFAMQNLLQDRVQQVEDWKRKVSSFRQDPRFV